MPRNLLPDRVIFAKKEMVGRNCFNGCSFSKPAASFINIHELVLLGQYHDHRHARFCQLSSHGYRRRHQQQRIGCNLTGRTQCHHTAERITREQNTLCIRVGTQPLDSSNGVIRFTLTIVIAPTRSTDAAVIKAKCGDTLRRERIVYRTQHRIMHGATHLGMGMAKNSGHV